MFSHFLVRGTNLLIVNHRLVDKLKIMIPVGTKIIIANILCLKGRSVHV